MRAGKTVNRKRRRRQRGWGIDVQKFLAQFWSGYHYMGPGTKLEKRLKRGDPGVNRLDRIAKQHDIDYSRAKNLQDKRKADAKMIKAIERLPGKETMTERVVKKNYASQETFEVVIFFY